MRYRMVLALFAWMFASSATAAVRRPPPTRPAERKLRLHEYRKSTFGPGAVARSAGAAGIKQLRNRPRQWGRGAGGYGRRFSSAFAQHAVKNTIQLGVGAIRHEDPRPSQPLKPKGFRPKIKDAFRNTFTVRRYGHRGRTVAAGRISGAMGSGLISQSWLPAAGLGAGFASGGIILGTDLGINTAREFIPDRKESHRVARGRRRQQG